VTLQIASSFLLATSGRAVRCNLYVFKEKTQRIFPETSGPSLTQRIPMTHHLFY
jgi:hypothetical protein